MYISDVVEEVQTSFKWHTCYIFLLVFPCIY